MQGWLVPGYQPGDSEQGRARRLARTSPGLQGPVPAAASSMPLTGCVLLPYCVPLRPGRAVGVCGGVPSLGALQAWA